MKIMCLNGWGGTLYEDLIPYLLQQQPDILCLQEVVHTPTAKKTWLTYRDGDHVLDQRADFYTDVCNVMQNHRAFFCPAAQGILWDGEEQVPSQWGLATFVRTDIPLIGQIQGFVHKDYSHDGYGDHPRSRSAHGVRVFDAKHNRNVSILHMHGLRDLAGKHDTAERATQVEALGDMARQLAKPGDMQVLCGDFNVTPDSATIEFLRAMGLTELVTTGGHTSTRTSHYRKRERYADYMFVNYPRFVQDFQVVNDPEVSDHCPLILEI